MHGHSRMLNIIVTHLGSKNIYRFIFLPYTQIANVHFLCLKLQSTLCDLYLSVPNTLIYWVFQREEPPHYTVKLVMFNTTNRGI